MSSDKKPGKLEVIGAAGVAYRVLDAASKIILQSAESAVLDLAAGLYAIEWFSGDSRTETVVRVTEGVTQSVRYPTPAPASKFGVAAAIGNAPHIVLQLRPSERDHGSGIAVVVAAQTKHDAANALSDIRLYDSRDITMRGDADYEPGIALEGSEEARSYRVRPGRYLLSYKALTGETLQQAVPALQGRQTVVFLDSRRGGVVVAEGKKLAHEHREGIDPGKTVIISVNGKEKDVRIRERLRLMGLLLYDLGGGAPALNEAFVEVLHQRATDPLLKLAAALAVITRIESEGSPALDAVCPSEPGALDRFRSEWLSRAAGWLRRRSFAKLPSDFVTAWWRLQSMGVKSSPKFPATIDAPPMFTCAWRWAASASIERKDAVRQSVVMLAAARSGGGTDPWFYWRSSAVKAKPGTLGEKDDRSTEQLVEAVASKAQEVVGSAENPNSASEIFNRLGSDAGIVTLSIKHLADQPSPHGGKQPMAPSLAAMLGLPDRALRRRLLRTAEALDAPDTTKPSSAKEGWVGSKSPGSTTRQGATDGKALKKVPHSKVTGSVTEHAPEITAKRPRRTPAPALSRRIKFPDDPQKGRFGGRSSRNDCTVTASFPSSKSSAWTRIVLTVTGPGRKGDEIEFHLHDSFYPQIEEKYFQNGEAQIAVTSWGGFTVGVWLPRQKTELELDLARAPGAPPNVRTR